ncbi:MAG TPA: PAS domain S-box protein [Ginsengibacter sp.]
MKATPHIDQARRSPDNEAKQKYLQEFRGHPELVKFPSTSELFRTLLENTFYASWIANGQGKTLEGNETACKVFGYTHGEMTQLTTNDLFDTTEKKYLDYSDQLQNNGKAKTKITGVRKDGERFSCEVTSLVFIDDDGERRTINTVVDISKYYSHILFE